MRPYWPKLASLAQKTCTLDGFQFFSIVLASKDDPFIEHITFGLLYLISNRMFISKEDSSFDV